MSHQLEIFPRGRWRIPRGIPGSKGCQCCLHRSRTWWVMKEGPSIMTMISLFRGGTMWEVSNYLPSTISKSSKKKWMKEDWNLERSWEEECPKVELGCPVDLDLPGNQFSNTWTIAKPSQVISHQSNPASTWTPQIQIKDLSRVQNKTKRWARKISINNLKARLNSKNHSKSSERLPTSLHKLRNMRKKEPKKRENQFNQ